MRLNLKPGKYILAVSGGVDSMVLLDLLSKKPGIEPIVAHFNHGIRPESSGDEAFVRLKARQLGLPFESGHGRLGSGASEEAARRARYAFLFKVKDKHKAKAVVTAHHQDDLIETALLNILRGSNRKGLVAIASNPEVIRPLLGVPKAEIKKYALAKRLEWKDDKSNENPAYLRNSLRRELAKRLDKQNRGEVLKNIDKVAKIDDEFDNEIAKVSHNIYKNNRINRSRFTALPIDVGDELVAYWLRRRGLREFDKRTLSRVNLALRTYPEGASCPVKAGLNLQIGRQEAYFSSSV